MSPPCLESPLFYIFFVLLPSPVALLSYPVLLLAHFPDFSINLHLDFLKGRLFCVARYAVGFFSGWMSILVGQCAACAAIYMAYVLAFNGFMHVKYIVFLICNNFCPVFFLFV